MKKLIFIFSLVAMCTSVAFSQVDFGVKTSIGATLASDETTLSGEVFDYINHEVTYKGSDLVKTYGLFAQKKFGYLFARTEVGYTHFKQDYRVRSFVQFGEGAKELTENFQFIDLQVLGGLTRNNFRVGVGPVAHVQIGSDPALDFISGSDFRYRKMTFGFTTSLGLDAGRFHIDLRYENNFRTVGDHIYYGNRDADFKSKPHVVNLTLGVSI